MSVDAPRPDWTTATLGSLGNFLRGRGGTKADVRAAGVPCIRYGDLYTQHNDIIRGIESFIAPERATAYTSLQVGDVVFAGSGETHEEIGKAAAFLGPDPAVVGADTIIFRPGSRLHPAYLGYAANATRAARYKARLGQGSSVIHIGTVQLKELSLDLPPLPEQRRIAEILDTLDEAIRKTEQVIAKLQQMKQGLLHDLLTRGIDEHGELRDPERHPEQFKDSPLGRIPRGWEVVPLGARLAGIDAGWSPSCPEEPPIQDQWGVLKVSAVSSGTYRPHESKRLPHGLRPVPSLEVQPNDVLCVRANGVAELVGKTVYVETTPTKLMLSDKTLRLRPSADTRPRFLYFLLSEQPHVARLAACSMEAAASGTFRRPRSARCW
jgi:type I restriction enzyme S subunit